MAIIYPRMTRAEALAELATLTPADLATCAPEDEISEEEYNRFVEAAHLMHGVDIPSLTDFSSVSLADVSEPLRQAG